MLNGIKVFGEKKSFKNKKIGTITTKAGKLSINIKSYIKWGVSFFLIGIIIYFWSNISLSISNYIKSITWSLAKVVAKSVSKEPKKDNLGNVNILLLGIGGENHAGGYLTDSMLIASFNPKYKTLTFLSIPRDLYVKYPWGGAGRINYIFAREYLKTKSFDKAAETLKKKIKEITDIDINYYVLVDFGGFVKFIDELGGVTINVPEDLIDTRYPGPNNTYITFKITKGIHTLDGETALKYARSRHSTSDFSRSARQEQIIKAIIYKLTNGGILFNPRKLKALYLQFQNTIKTDMNFETMLSFVPYSKGLKIHSYVLNADCYYKQTYWKNLTPGCFVYPPPRADFNGQSVLLPVGASAKKIDNYDEIKKFVFIALGYPELWLENAKIQILNGVDKKKIRKYYKGYLKPIASKLAYKLKNYGFNIVDVGNATKTYSKTIDYIYNKKPITQELLKTFVGNIEYQTGNVKYAGKGFDMTLILGNNYLEK